MKCMQQLAHLQCALSITSSQIISPCSATAASLNLNLKQDPSTALMCASVRLYTASATQQPL